MVRLIVHDEFGKRKFIFLLQDVERLAIVVCAI